jgi:hypothetical protein
MSGELQQELQRAIWSNKSLEEIVTLLRAYKQQGVRQDEVYSFLETLRKTAPNEAVEDRILEVADFVAGFCSPHMKVWDN